MIIPVILLCIIVFAGELPAFDNSQAGVNIHGFISQGYLTSDHNNFFAQTEDGSFQYNEMGINFITQQTDKLRLGVQFFARDLGKLGNDEIIIDWAVADYKWRDWLGFTAGKTKIAHGLYNFTRDVDMLRTFVFLPQSVYNEGWRDVIAAVKGAGFYGSTPDTVLGSLSYRFTGGTLEIGTDSGAARHFQDQIKVPDELDLGDGTMIPVIPPTIESIEVEHAFGGEIQWYSPIENLKIGGSMWDINFSADVNFPTSIPVDITIPNVGEVTVTTIQGVNNFELSGQGLTAYMEFTWEDLIIALEHTRTNYEIQTTESSLLTPFTTIPQLVAYGISFYDMMGLVPEFYSEGYYGSITYRFTDWFESGVYYSEYYPKAYDRSGTKRKLSGEPYHSPSHKAWLKDACLALRFDVNESWVIKLEGHLMDGAAIMLGSDNPEWYTEDNNWHLFAAKVTFNF